MGKRALRVEAPRPGPPGVGDSDAFLVEGIRRGESSALRAFYAAHATRALRIALRVLRDPHDAEEVVQETFFELWRRSGEFDAARGGASNWVATIARSRAIDRLRASDKDSRAVDALAMVWTRPDQQVPDQVAERHDAEQHLHRALRGLPREQRQAIGLSYYRGLSHREIADKTGAPLGTVKMRLRLALGKLSTALARNA